MRIEEIQVYTFNELSESAKEKARDWYRSASAGDDFEAECVFDDAVTIAGILGIDIATQTVRLMNGSTRQKPRIYYSGFWSQGDGACFEGSYAYAAGASKAIRSYAPNDKDLHAIADGLQAAQRKHFYQLTASVAHSGRYYHEHSTTISVEDNRDSWRDIGDAESDVADLLRDFMRWIYKQLESEWEFRNSDEQVTEMIECNAYEFTADGEIH